MQDTGNGQRSFIFRRKIQQAFMLLTGLAVIVLSMLLFVVYLYSQLETAKDYSISHLQQISGSADILLDQVATVQNSIYSDTAIYKSMVNRRLDRLDEAQAVQKLRSIQSSHPYIRFTGVYNPNLLRYITSAGVYGADSLAPETLFGPLGSSTEVSLPRQLGSDYPTSPAKVPVYSFFRRPNPYSSTTGNAVITIDISQDYLLSLISTIQDDGDERQIIVMDGERQIISHTDRSLYMTGADALPFAERVLAQDAPYGSLTVQTEDGATQLLTFVHSPHTGWLFIALQPLGTVFQNVAMLAGVTLLLTAALLVFSFFISRRVSMQLHSPIRTLVERFAPQVAAGKPGADINEMGVLGEAFSQTLQKADTLENTLSASLAMTRNTYTRFLLEGDVFQIRKFAPAFERMNINLESAAFAPVLITYFHTGVAQPTNADLLLYPYALENIACELLGTLCPYSFAPMGDDRFAALLFLPDQALPEKLDETLIYLADIMQREFSLNVTSSIGPVVAQWEQISTSYDRAVIAMNQRQAMEHRPVLRAGDILSGIVIKQYPQGIQNRLTEYVRAQNRQQVYAVVDEMMDFLVDATWDYAQNCCKHIMLTLLGRFDSLLEADNDTLRRLFTAIEEVDRCHSLDTLEAVVTGYMDQLLDRMGERKKGGANAAVEKVCAHVAEHYGDPDVSMNTMAELAGLSPAYLGKIFYLAKAMTFTDHLNGVRLEQAARLLEETDQPIAEISAAVGITNNNYFYTIFKKKYGATPAAWRKKHPRPAAPK